MVSRRSRPGSSSTTRMRALREVAFIAGAFGWRMVGTGVHGLRVSVAGGRSGRLRSMLAMASSLALASSSSLRRRAFRSISSCRRLASAALGGRRCAGARAPAALRPPGARSRRSARSSAPPAAASTTASARSTTESSSGRARASCSRRCACCRILAPDARARPAAARSAARPVPGAPVVAAARCGQHLGLFGRAALHDGLQRLRCSSHSCAACTASLVGAGGVRRAACRGHGCCTAGQQRHRRSAMCDPRQHGLPC